MISVLSQIKPQIDATIASLDKAKFTKDPIAGTHFSKTVSVMSSAYKRHGHILEQAIIATLKTNPNFDVWSDAVFPVTQSADQMVVAALKNPQALTSVSLPIEGPIRTLQIDLVVFDKEKKTLSAYEVKRGNGLHDAGKKRSMIRDAMCTQVLLRSYGEAKGFSSARSFSHIIFYYGKCSVGAPWAVKGSELDAHFGYPIYEAVEEVNEYYRQQLFSILSA